MEPALEILRTRDRERSESEMVIHRLYEITSRYDAGFDQQLRELLALGCDRFGLEIGIVARIDGSVYEVRQAVAPAGVSLGPGDSFPIGETYCSVTLDADGPVGFAHAGGSSWASHPAYAKFRLEAYFGTPLYARGEPFGTLNFSSAHARVRAFEAVDVDCLRLMGSWISSELGRQAMESELREARRHLENLVRTDPLTELRNRRGMAEVLQDYARRSRYAGAILSSVLIDIDDFKQVNDSFGHSAGDRVIRAVAEAIRSCLRPTDVAARIGGDEFLVILPDAGVVEAHGVARRMVDTVGCLDLIDCGVPIPVTVSIGAAEVPAEAASVTDILECTEELLRRSKQAGKNTVST